MGPASQFDWHIKNAVHIANQVTGCERVEVSQLVWLPSWVSWDEAKDDTPDLADSYTDGILADVIEGALADYDSDVEYEQEDEIGSQGDIETRGTGEVSAASTLGLQMCLKWEHPVSRHVMFNVRMLILVDTFVNTIRLHFRSLHPHTAASCPRINLCYTNVQR